MDIVQGLLVFALRERRRELGLTADEVEQRARRLGKDDDSVSYEQIEELETADLAVPFVSAYSEALETSAPALLVRAARIGFDWTRPAESRNPAEWSVPLLNESRSRRIASRRAELGLTQKQVAEEMRRLAPELDPDGPEDRTSAESVNIWESGRRAPTVTKIVLLAGALRMSPLELCVIDSDIEPGQY